jgi:hypothetical protein
MPVRGAVTRTRLVAEFQVTGQEVCLEHQREPVAKLGINSHDEIATQCLLGEMQLPLEHSPLYEAFA